MLAVANYPIKIDIARQVALCNTALTSLHIQYSRHFNYDPMLALLQKINPSKCIAKRERGRKTVKNIQLVF